MTYIELIQELNSKNPNPNYYHLLLDNAQTIIIEVAKRNQGVVARDINMSGSKFSILVSILKEFA